MINQYDSIGKLMSKITRDIRIQDSSMKNDLIEWACDALDLLNTTHQLLPQQKELTLYNYKAKLPCGINSIQAVTCNGVRIRCGDNQYGHLIFNDVLPSRNYFHYWESQPADVVPDINAVQSSLNALREVLTYEVYSDDYYYAMNGELETSINEGKIVIYYLGVKIDSEGYPLVPRNALLSEAVVSYIDYKLARWNKDRDWPTLQQDWNIACSRAINDIEYLSPDETRSLLDNTLGLIKPDYYEQFI